MSRNWFAVWLIWSGLCAVLLLTVDGLFVATAVWLVVALAVAGLGNVSYGRVVNYLFGDGGRSPTEVRAMLDALDPHCGSMQAQVEVSLFLGLIAGGPIGIFVAANRNTPVLIGGITGIAVVAIFLFALSYLTGDRSYGPSIALLREVVQDACDDARVQGYTTVYSGHIILASFGGRPSTRTVPTELDSKRRRGTYSAGCLLNPNNRMTLRSSYGKQSESRNDVH